MTTIMPGTIRGSYVTAPLRRSVFELRPRDHNRDHRHARSYQGPLCHRPAPTLGFRVTAPGPQPWPPPCPELSGSPMSMPPSDAPFSSYAPGTMTMVTATPRSISVPYVKAPLRRSVFELRPRDHTHGHRHARNYQGPHVDAPLRRSVFELRPRDHHGHPMPDPIRVPYVMAPLGRSVFELRPRDHTHGYRRAWNYQGPLCQRPAPMLRFGFTPVLS